MNISQIVIFSKPSCPFCVKAKELIEKNDINYRENIIGEDCSKEDMQDCVKTFSPGTEVNTVPQIFVYKNSAESAAEIEYVGGCDEFYKYMGET